MYAKLVVGTSNIMAVGAIRDIGRLITATAGNVSTSLLGAFSVSSSVILDATPAGWTYVGSNTASDQPTIGPTNTVYAQTANTASNVCFSAPCLEGTALKYCALTNFYNTQSPANAGTGTGTPTYFCLTGAVAATSLGILTNEGPRLFSGTSGSGASATLQTQAGDVVHVIATPRHITIINENRGVIAVWESSMTDVNRFYSTAPFIQYTHPLSTAVSFTSEVSPGSVTSPAATAFGVTDVNTGTYYGGYDICETGGSNKYFLAQTDIASRKNSIDSLGNPKYQITPILYTAHKIGHPVQYVSGVVPAYWTKPGLGNTGDNVLVGTETYTYFNCGAGFGLIMQTD